MNEPKHGDIRDHHYETLSSGKSHDLLDGKTGEVVYSGPLASVTQTTCEKWCGHCKKWIRCAGVMGPIRFMAFHDKGDCANEPPEAPPAV